MAGDTAFSVTVRVSGVDHVPTGIVKLEHPSCD